MLQLTLRNGSPATEQNKSSCFPRCTVGVYSCKLPLCVIAGDSNGWRFAHPVLKSWQLLGDLRIQSSLPLDQLCPSPVGWTSLLRLPCYPTLALENKLSVTHMSPDLQASPPHSHSHPVRASPWRQLLGMAEEDRHLPSHHWASSWPVIQTPTPSQQPNTVPGLSSLHLGSNWASIPSNLPPFLHGEFLLEYFMSFFFSWSQQLCFSRVLTKPISACDINFASYDKVLLSG